MELFLLSFIENIHFSCLPTKMSKIFNKNFRFFRKWVWFCLQRGTRRRIIVLNNKNFVHHRFSFFLPGTDIKFGCVLGTPFDIFSLICQKLGILAFVACRRVSSFLALSIIGHRSKTGDHGHNNWFLCHLRRYNRKHLVKT